MSEEPTIEYLVNLSNKLSAEVERLEEENAHFAWRDKDKNKLITELVDAAEKYLNVDGSRKIFDAAQLIVAAGNLEYQLQRAREATKDE